MVGLYAARGGTGAGEGVAAHGSRAPRVSARHAAGVRERPTHSRRRSRPRSAPRGRSCPRRARRAPPPHEIGVPWTPAALPTARTSRALRRQERLHSWIPPVVLHRGPRAALQCAWRGDAGKVRCLVVFSAKVVRPRQRLPRSASSGRPDSHAAIPPHEITEPRRQRESGRLPAAYRPRGNVAAARPPGCVRCGGQPRWTSAALVRLSRYIFAVQG